jgi:hypothetical protein
MIKIKVGDVYKDSEDGDLFQILTVAKTSSAAYSSGRGKLLNKPMKTKYQLWDSDALLVKKDWSLVKRDNHTICTCNE